MVGGAPKRVQCLTCNKQHNYRAPRVGGVTATRSKPASARSGAAPRQTAHQREWHDRVASRDANEFVPYSIRATFESGQLIRHPKFGRGIVKEAVGEQKVSVVFEDAVRTLIQGRV